MWQMCSGTVETRCMKLRWTKCNRQEGEGPGADTGFTCPLVPRPRAHRPRWDLSRSLRFKPPAAYPSATESATATAPFDTGHLAYPIPKAEYEGRGWAVLGQPTDDILSEQRKHP